MGLMSRVLLVSLMSFIAYEYYLIHSEVINLHNQYVDQHKQVTSKYFIGFAFQSPTYKTPTDYMNDFGVIVLEKIINIFEFFLYCWVHSISAMFYFVVHPFFYLQFPFFYLLI